MQRPQVRAIDGQKYTKKTAGNRLRIFTKRARVNEELTSGHSADPFFGSVPAAEDTAPKRFHDARIIEELGGERADFVFCEAGEDK